MLNTSEQNLVEKLLERLVKKLRPMQLGQSSLTARREVAEHVDYLVETFERLKVAEGNLQLPDQWEAASKSMRKAAKEVAIEELNSLQLRLQSATLKLIDLLGWSIVSVMAKDIVELLARAPQATKALGRLENAEESSFPHRFFIACYLSEDRAPEEVFSHGLEHLRSVYADRLTVEHSSRSGMAEGRDAEDYKDGVCLIVRCKSPGVVIDLRGDDILSELGFFVGFCLEMVG